MMIRMATLDDVDFIVDKGELMAQESSYKVYAYNHDKVRALVENLINSDVGFVCVAESGGVKIGWMFGACVEHWFSSDKVATEMTTYILPEYRGGSDAPRMIKAFKKWAENMGATETQIGITTAVNEERTSALYERLGFHPAGRIFKCVQV
jgi:GNAT superfamily N-acetyltransferase